MFGNFHFLTPGWLLLFPCFLLLASILYRRQLNRSHWGEVCDPELLPFLEQKNNEQRRSIWLPIALLIAGLLLSIAAAQPVWKQQPQPVFKQGDAVVIALDLSASMNATDIKPSRIQRAHFKIKDLLARLPDTQIALLVYAAGSFSVTPLTEDADTILAQLSAMTPDIMPLQGSRADRALVRADRLLMQAGITQGNILFVSDEISPAQIAKDATRLRIAGRQLSILAIGTEEGAPIPTNAGLIKDSQGQVVIATTEMGLMQEAANLGGGYAALITADDSDIDYLVSRFQENEVTPAVLDEKVQRWIAEGPLFILAALPFLLVIFRRGFVTLLIPMIFMLGVAKSNDAEAGIWDDLWKTSDQQARELYEQGDITQAAEKFSDPRWKQRSHYENGDYEQALSAIETPESAADWYNRGNVLTRQGALEKALEAYDKALSRQPDFEDAKFNRDLVQETLDQQQSEKDQEGKGSDQKGDKQKGSDQDKSKNSEQQNSQHSDAQENGSEGQDAQNSNSQSSNSQENSSQEEQSGKDGSNDQNSPSEDSKSKGESSLDSSKDDTKRTQSNSSSQDMQNESQKSSNREQDKQMAEALKQQLNQQLDKKADADPSKPTLARSDGEEHQPLDEEAEARQQMLNRIEDDPAGLWRRKFHYQYRQQLQGQGQNTEEKAW
ncbi:MULTISPECIES: VWA domain-containing protein [unclassified Neptuniibacter]|uniref:VWA domain-containing protein n=1 Tax=unclassified Neptuniibacter TaxID=2630693 RepID=UPI000C5E93EA|nr:MULTISPECIES: VWA domain-containing protein [unclassified Neptuniibacter]MAY42846.1 hypothetical protein [Oceanospirillaceae bacterium]|tara:strand:+ start:7954 stop:9954 length:2001 start_codon:yes stop_codon:yes gene_type:complete